MLKIDMPIVVEGKYDKIKLSSFIDGFIIQTDGFRIFKDKQKCEMIKKLGLEKGLIIVTDSDVAGFTIRNHIKSILGKQFENKIYHIYIPQILGKEKRKTEFSKEGTLGVEGIPIDILKDCFEKAGVLDYKLEKPQNKKLITKNDFLDAGLIGADNSSEKRKEILKHLNLPPYLSTKDLIKTINSVLNYGEYIQLVNKINK